MYMSCRAEIQCDSCACITQGITPRTSANDKNVFSSVDLRIIAKREYVVKYAPMYITSVSPLLPF
jgi:hypothetical protein